MLCYFRSHSEFRRHSEKSSCLFQGVFSHPQNNASETVTCGDGWDKKHCWLPQFSFLASRIPKFIKQIIFK
jgi:hypothetical protein